MRDTVSEIKDRLSITDVIGGYVKLRKAGRSYTGLCPFHKEKTPSFHVSLERGSFHCFGCGVGGDMFTFIEKVEGVDFKGAMKILAERAGVEIEYTQGARENKSKQDRLREVMQKAADFYASKLVKGGGAYEYALSRGLTADTIKEWGLGFAPDDWRELLEHLSAAGFSLEELASAGLIKEADGKRGTYYDRFRNRLMFPIRDSAGRVVAFTGRALDPYDLAKYLNSPETDLYHKSDILFGLDKAKEPIRTRGFVMLVEGQMDLLHAHQAGFANTVALSGTALTDKHIALMKRYSENLMLVLDADSAGLTATAKAAQLALKAGMRVKAARLPAGKDPADVISADAKDFANRIKEGKPVVEFFLAVLAEREKEQHRLVMSAERIVLPLIAAIPSPLEREHFVGIAARALGLSSEAVKESLKRVPKIEEEPEAKPKGASATKPERVGRAESLAAIAKLYPGSALAKRIETEYSRIVGIELDTDTVSEVALFEAEQTFPELSDEHQADDLIRAFEEAYIREAYREAVSQLRRAETTRDPVAIKEAENLCKTLSAKLALLH